MKQESRHPIAIAYFISIADDCQEKMPSKVSRPMRDAMELAKEASFSVGELEAYRKVMDEIQQARDYGETKKAEGHKSDLVEGYKSGLAEGNKSGVLMSFQGFDTLRTPFKHPRMPHRCPKHIFDTTRVPSAQRIRFLRQA